MQINSVHQALVILLITTKFTQVQYSSHFSRKSLEVHPPFIQRPYRVGQS